MYFPISLRMNNVASHKATFYQFSKNKVRVILGVNLDDLGQESNGAGKSMIAEGLVISLVGEPFRKLRVVELIRDDEDFLDLEFELYNPSLKQTLKIYRKFLITGKQEIKIWVNNELQKLAGIDAHQKFIYDCIKISKEDILNYFIIQKDKYKPFFSLTDSAQREIISRFSGAHLIKGVEDRVNEDIKKIDEDIKENDKKILSLESKIEVYQEQYDNLENKDFDKEKESIIQNYKANIEKKNTSIADINNKINLLNQTKENIVQKIDLEEDSLKNFKLELSLIPVIDFTAELKKYQDEEDEFIQIKNSIISAKENYEKVKNEIIKNINKLTVSLEDFIQCPKCYHKFSLKDKDWDEEEIKRKIKTLNLEKLKHEADLKEAEEDKILIQEEINTIEEAKNKLLEELKKNNELKISIQKKITSSSDEINKQKNNLIQVENEIIFNKNKIIQIEKEIQIIKNDIEIEENKNNSDVKQKELKEIQLKIKNCEIQVKEIKKYNLFKENEKSDISEWLVLFKRFNVFLTNQGIKSIEGYTNWYLEKMGTNLNVLIEGEKMLADNKTQREEISCYIIRNGMIKGNFNRYSNGEKIRMIGANILCFQKLINANTGDGGLALCILDEIVESADSKGVRLFFKSLEDINQPIEIITHTNHNIVNVETVVFTKENEVTTYQILNT